MSNGRILDYVTLERRGIRIECKCGHLWTYCGNRVLFATCPKCHTTISLRPKHKSITERIMKIQKRNENRKQLQEKKKEKASVRSQPSTTLAAAPDSTSGEETDD